MRPPLRGYDDPGRENPVVGVQNRWHRPAVRIEPVDPCDEGVFAAWFSVIRAAEEEIRPGQPASLLHEERAAALEAQEDDPDRHLVALLARDDEGRSVGAARMSLPLRDNLHLCELEFAVHPQARRRGVGRALLADVERRAREQGRTTLLIYADEPPAQVGSSAGRAFATALGYTWAQEEIPRDLDLPLDPQRAADLEATCAPYALDYTVQAWRDGWPEGLLDDRAELMRRMSIDVPLGSIDFREEKWDRDRFRRHEQRNRAMDRELFAAGAVHRATGRLVAASDMVVPRSVPERAYQNDTIVLPEHRGHRLGTLVKIAALRCLSQGSPRTRYISTWNAEENAAMIAINDALGSRVVGCCPAFQKVLAQ